MEAVHSWWMEAVQRETVYCWWMGGRMFTAGGWRLLFWERQKTMLSFGPLFIIVVTVLFEGTFFKCETTSLLVWVRGDEVATFPS